MASIIKLLLGGAVVFSGDFSSLELLESEELSDDELLLDELPELPEDELLPLEELEVALLAD